MLTHSPRLILALAALLALAAPLSAKFAVRPGWVKAYVNSASPAALANLVVATDSELLWIFTNDDRAVVYTPSLSTLSARAAQMGMRAIAAKDISDLATVGPLVFDPRDVVPQPDDIRSYRSNDPGLFVLHFAVNPDPGYVPQLEALGIEVVAEGARNTAVVMALPLQIENADALPWVAYRDFLQPWMKRDRAIDPERYYSALVTVAPGAPNADQIAFGAAQPAFASSPDGSCYLGADLAPILEHPLVLSVRVRPSLVEIGGVLPGEGPAGSEIFVNTNNAAFIHELRFNGITAAFSRTDLFRVRATVPQGLPQGPVDILALRNDGWRQSLPARADFGFHVAEHYGRTLFDRGDLIVMSSDDDSVILPPLLHHAPQWWTPQGELRRHPDEALGELLHFGAQGLLNTTSAGNPVRFDARLERAGAGPSILKDVLSMTMARDGTSFLVVAGELRRHAPGGELQAKVLLPVIRSVDLDVDQCTLVLALFDGLKLFDGCRMTSLSTIRTGDWRAARFLPDGTILASSHSDGAVYRLGRSGSVLAKTSLEAPALALAPDASFAWLASGEGFYRFDLATNALSGAFTAPGRIVQTLTVYGEWTAAHGEARYDDAIAIESVSGFDARPGEPVTITGRSFLTGAQVTIGGLPVPSPAVGETRITFPMPAGTKTSRELVITNPNGERGTYTARKPKRRAA